MSKAKELSSAEVVEIPLAQIATGINVRTKTGSVTSLRDSIAEIGLVHPIVVAQRKDLCEAYGKPYLLVAGGRRLSAYSLMRAKSIPARVAPDLGLDTLIKMQIEENEERSDLDEYDRSRARLAEVREEFERLLGEQVVGEAKLALYRKQAEAAQEGRTSSGPGARLLSRARARVGVTRDVGKRDAQIERIVKKYPELERWSRRTMLAASEAMDGVAPEERAGLRAYAAAFAPKECGDAAEGIVNLANKWPAPLRTKLLRKLKSDPENVKAASWDAPPVADERLAGLNLLIDDLSKILREYPKRDEARTEMTVAMEHLETARKFLKAAFERVKDEIAALR